jgi:hypothetical protein
MVVTKLTYVKDVFYISLENEGASANFELRLEDVSGIPLLTGADSLIKWLMRHGKLSDLSHIYRRLDLVAASNVPPISLKLGDKI